MTERHPILYRCADHCRFLAQGYEDISRSKWLHVGGSQHMHAVCAHVRAASQFWA